jgi:pimeloyl-ACP methyl ester carboxylesterase
LNPEKAARVVALCPAFDLPTCFEANLLGADKMQLWKERGELEFNDLTVPGGRLVPVHYEFIVDAERHGAHPPTPCPTLIIHGSQDALVPFVGSQRYAGQYPGRVELVQVEDGHELVKSLAPIVAATGKFLGISLELGDA